MKYTESGSGREKECGRCNSETLFQNLHLSAKSRNIRNLISQNFLHIFFKHVFIDLSCGNSLGETTLYEGISPFINLRFVTCKIHLLVLVLVATRSNCLLFIFCMSIMTLEILTTSSS